MMRGGTRSPPESGRYIPIVSSEMRVFEKRSRESEKLYAGFLLNTKYDGNGNREGTMGTMTMYDYIGASYPR
jgi:hypothetical protein